MAIQTEVPSQVTTIANGGIPSWGGPATYIDFIDGLYLSSFPWNTNVSNGYTSGFSNLLYSYGYGFGFLPTDTLSSIFIKITFKVGIVGQGIAFPEGGTTLQIGFGTIQCYQNGASIGIASSATYNYAQSTITYTAFMNANPTIAQVNSNSFGIILDSVGSAFGMNTTYTTNDGVSIPLAIDQIQLMIQTQAGVNTGIGTTSGPGSPGLPPLGIIVGQNSTRHIPPLDFGVINIQ